MNHLLYGPCEDDVEVTCPYVGMLPDETDSIRFTTYDSYPHFRIGDGEEYDDVNDLSDELEVNRLLYEIHGVK